MTVPGKGGQPAMPYDPEVGDKICDRISDGRSLRSICADDDMPSKVTVFKWLRLNEEFANQYTKARQEQAETMADDMLDIADDGTNDYVTRTRPDGSEYEAFDAEHVQRSRLRIETRKWIASKLKPKKYGDKVDVTSDGEKITMPTAIKLVGVAPKPIEDDEE